MTLREIKILIITSMLAICAMLGIDIHLASLPYIMQYMHTDKLAMQHSVTFFLLGMGISLLVYGPLSDKYGRKPVVIFGLTLATLASFAAAATHHIEPFLITRILQGIGSGVCMGLGRSIVADVLQGERLAQIGSYFSLFLSLSPLLAPMVGGYVQHWLGWQANFVLLGCFLLLSLLLYSLFCPETNKHKNPRAFKPINLLKIYGSLLIHPMFIGCALLTGIAMASNMIYATTSSFVFHSQFHLSPITYGWITTLAGIGAFVGKFVNPFAIKKIGSLKTLLFGIWLLLIAGIWLVTCVIFHMLWIPVIMSGIFIMIFSQSFITPNAMARALSPFHDKRGAAAALYGSSQMLIAFIGSALAARFAFEGISLFGVAYTLLGLIGLLIFYFLARR